MTKTINTEIIRMCCEKDCNAIYHKQKDEWIPIPLVLRKDFYEKFYKVSHTYCPPCKTKAMTQIHYEGLEPEELIT